MSDYRIKIVCYAWCENTTESGAYEIGREIAKELADSHPHQAIDSFECVDVQNENSNAVPPRRKP
jgi:hypothetical protein